MGFDRVGYGLSVNKYGEIRKKNNEKVVNYRMKQKKWIFDKTNREIDWIHETKHVKLMVRIAQTSVESEKYRREWVLTLRSITRWWILWQGSSDFTSKSVSLVAASLAKPLNLAFLINAFIIHCLLHIFLLNSFSALFLLCSHTFVVSHTLLLSPPPNTHSSTHTHQFSPPQTLTGVN